MELRHTGLTSVTIGNGVTSIGNAAFYNCYKLVEVYNRSALNITKGKTAYGYVGCYAKAVYTAPYVSKLSTDENGYILYTDGDNVSLIGYTGTDTELTLPSGITEINQGAFSHCTGLTSITYQGTKAQWNAISKESDWNYNTGSYTIHCTDGDISK